MDGRLHQSSICFQGSATLRSPIALVLRLLFGASPAGGINGSNGSLRFALLPNNAFHAPSVKYVDLRISRRFTIKENAKIEVAG